MVSRYASFQIKARSSRIMPIFFREEKAQKISVLSVSLWLNPALFSQ